MRNMTLPRDSPSVGQPSSSTASSRVRAVAADVVGGDHPVGREDRADLGVEARRARPASNGVGLDEVEVAETERRVLQLQQDRDRHVAGCGVGPGLHRPEALHEREAGRVVVDVLDVQHLDARARSWPGRSGPPPVDARGAAGRRTAAVGVGEHVELDLADLLVGELLASGAWVYSRPSSSSPMKAGAASRSAGVASRW